jgi:hypothetical protein
LSLRNSSLRKKRDGDKNGAQNTNQSVHMGTIIRGGRIPSP